MASHKTCGRCQSPYESRRDFLQRSALGMGSLGLAMLLGRQETARADEAVSLHSKRVTHFAPKAKYVIHVFPEGGPSHIDTFDPKPALDKYHGKLVKDVMPDFEKKAPQTATQMGRLSGKFQQGGFKFSKHGQSGIEVSELFPHLAKQVDEMCIVRSMSTTTPVHEPAQLMMSCGDALMVRPSIGSWSVYGLGAENQNLPAFVTLHPNGAPPSGDKHYGNAFLPGFARGTPIATKQTDVLRMIEHIRSESTSIKEQRRQLDLLAEMNREHMAPRSEPILESRVQSFETAFRMQIEATDAFDISREPAHIRALYGDTEQGRQLLLARRLVERGVRFVQVWHNGWDTHDENDKGHRDLCKAADQPLAALLQDLKQRGLLKDTLVLWAGEFGRTPTSDNNEVSKKKGIGRDHNAGGFTIWMAGGGMKGGLAYGSTDEFGAIAQDNKMEVHDLHATILHALGFDHEKLTYRFSGRDFRLTDVHGHVVKELFA
jgi:hypothetical protein